MAYKYKRVLLKLSGEALKGNGEIYDNDALEAVANEIIFLAKQNVELGIVIGGGNIWRGNLSQSMSMPQIDADYMGMMATIMNGLALESKIKNLGYQKVSLYSSLNIDTVTEDYNYKKARIKMTNGYISIFVGGTGYSYFTTDTTSVIRAIEIGADVILMAKNGIKGVYDKDPKTNKDAIFYPKLSYKELIDKQLAVMDLTAVTLAENGKIKIEVFDMQKKNSIIQVMSNELESTIIS